jgi:hypothetical protein
VFQPKGRKKDSSYAECATSSDLCLLPDPLAPRSVIFTVELLSESSPNTYRHIVGGRMARSCSNQSAALAYTQAIRSGLRNNGGLQHIFILSAAVQRPEEETGTKLACVIKDATPLFANTAGCTTLTFESFSSGTVG